MTDNNTRRLSLDKLQEQLNQKGKDGRQTKQDLGRNNRGRKKESNKKA